METPKHSRRAWIEACEFRKEAEVLETVLERMRGTPSRPVVLLDLDSTLYEVGPRTHFILGEWCELGRGTPEIRGALRALAPEKVGYSLLDTWVAAGMDVNHGLARELVREAKAFWSERFFTSAYLKHDRPYPHAAEFVQEIHAAGAEIVYLTGRDEPGMGEGTRANLIRDRFPWGVERTRLLTKRDRDFPDLEHKRLAAETVRRMGTLVASFENEPLNLVAIESLFPEAMHVFVDTVCSEHPAEPRKGLYRIRGWDRRRAR